MLTCCITTDTVSNYFALMLCFSLYTVSKISDLKLFDCLLFFVRVAS